MFRTSLITFAMFALSLPVPGMADDKEPLGDLLKSNGGTFSVSQTADSSKASRPATNVPLFDFSNLDMGGFTLSQVYPPTRANGVTSRIADYKNEALEATLTIEVVEMQTPEARKRVIGEALQVPGGTLPPQGYSGLPLGEQSGHGGSAEQGGLRQTAFADGCGVIVTLQYGTEAQGDESRVRLTDPQADTRMVEGLARWTLARMLGEKMKPVAPGSGKQAASMGFLTEKGVHARPLAAWARANRIGFRVDRRLGTATLTKAGRTIVLPLGANAVQVDGQWLPLSDFVRCRGDVWYVPKIDLERLAR